MASLKVESPPFAQFRPSQDTQEGGGFNLFNVVSTNFSLLTVLLAGASVQSLVIYLIPAGHYTLVLSTIMLLAKFAKSYLQARGVLSNPYVEGVIPGRTTALLPDLDSGTITTASSRKIAVFHLGAKSNHPYGYFAPQFLELGNYLKKMNQALDSGEVRGFLGQTTFARRDGRGLPEAVLISYWQSIEDVWAFAHSSVHMEGWKWWEKTLKNNGYIGLNHEIFEADAKHWENVYINFQPTLMGATTHLVKDGNKIEGGVVNAKYISPLVDANRGAMARSSGRLGRPVTRHDTSRGARNEYEKLN